MVANTEQNADGDASVHTNPSTSKGMCQYVSDPNTRTGMSITGNGNSRVLVPTYTS